MSLDIAGNKMRTLYSDDSLTADVTSSPDFPSGPDANGRILFLGDFKGAEIVGFQFESDTWDTVTALDADIEHSPDGTNWSTLKALTQIAAAGPKVSHTDLDDGDPEPFQFLRVGSLAATGAYGSVTLVKVKVIFRQVGAKGPLAPPGYKDKRD